MLRRVLFVSTLILASTIGFAGSAKAEPVSDEAIFNGEILASCSIQATAEGVLESEDGLSLTSETDAANAATVAITCPGGEVSVVAPVANAASTLTDNKAEDITPTVSEATVALDSITGEADSSGAKLQIPDTTTTAVTGKVNMTVTNATPLPAGEYSYAVTVTVTPEVAPL
ncbi:MAG: hypothetical protein KME29_04455 [Calothrix sp. FI2-JRJ7]|jgi:hypothetical protein|nr:hypothetical protein [Calothrix sp. FI2-JRJ7]